MDAVGPNVSSKIRAAIKAKLVELNAYVDDELPDYIMVIVANHKPKDQMEKDLSLFLNENTKAFVEWLILVLEKLKQVSASQGDKESKGDKKKKKKKKEKTEKKTSTKEPQDSIPRKRDIPPVSEKSEVSASKSKEDEYDPVEEKRRCHDRRRSSSPKRISQSRHVDQFEDRSHSRRRFDPSLRNHHSPPRHSHKRDSGGFRKDSYGERGLGGDQILHHERSGGSALGSSVGAIISHDSDGEYDPEKILKKSLLASEIRVTSRPKTDAHAAGMNKSLLLKAVADADRSILSKQREDRKRVDELESVHHKRMQLSKARKEGTLDKHRIEEINKRLPAAGNIESHRRDEGAKPSLRSSREGTRRSDDGERHRRDSMHEEDKQRGIPKEQHSSDLRSRLGKRVSESAFVEAARASGLTVRLDNVVVDDHEDRHLEEMRRKAIESMLQRQQSNQSNNGQAAKGSEQNKVQAAKKDSSSGDSSSSSSSSSDSDSEVSLSEGEDSTKATPTPRADPQFIVTMDGIGKEYFSSKKAPTSSSVESAKISVVVRKAPSATTKENQTPSSHVGAAHSGQPVVSSAVELPSPRKPEAKVAPLPPEPTTKAPPREDPKPKRARIKAPSPPRAKAAAPAKPTSSLPPSIASSGDVMQKGSQERCKYWPKCARGDSCFYFHPKKPTADPAVRFKWTSASIVP